MLVMTAMMTLREDHDGKVIKNCAPLRLQYINFLLVHTHIEYTSLPRTHVARSRVLRVRLLHVIVQTMCEKIIIKIVSGGANAQRARVRSVDVGDDVEATATRCRADTTWLDCKHQRFIIIRIYSSVCFCLCL